MAAQSLDQQTFLPTADDKVAEVLGLSKAYEVARGTRRADRYFLVGPREGDQVEIPESVYRGNPDCRSHGRRQSGNCGAAESAAHVAKGRRPAGR